MIEEERVWRCGISESASKPTQLNSSEMLCLVRLFGCSSTSKWLNKHGQGTDDIPGSIALFLMTQKRHGAALCCHKCSIVEFSLSVECVSIRSTAPNENKNTKKPGEQAKKIQITRRSGTKDPNETNNPDAPLHDRRSNRMAMAIKVSLRLFGQWGRSTLERPNDIILLIRLWRR